MPRRRAHQATPCAMLPALAVHTPRARASGSATAMALPALLSLKEPMGCRFYSLRWSSAGASSTFRRRSGVRAAIPATRARAARTSSSEGASSPGIPRSAQLHARAGPRLHRVVVDEPGGGHVLHGQAQGLEDGDLRVRLPARAAPEEQLAELSADVAVVDRALPARDQEVAGFVQRRLATVDEQSDAHNCRLAEHADGGHVGP